MLILIQPGHISTDFIGLFNYFLFILSPITDYFRSLKRLILFYVWKIFILVLLLFFIYLTTNFPFVSFYAIYRYMILALLRLGSGCALKSFFGYQLWQKTDLY